MVSFHLWCKFYFSLFLGLEIYDNEFKGKYSIFTKGNI